MIDLRRYWINKLFCWHSQRHRKIQMSVNGAVVYCSVCYRKKIGVYEFED